MEGFTIKCNKCGKEQMLQTGYRREYEDKPIDFYTTGYYVDQIDVNVSCECGNEIELSQ